MTISAPTVVHDSRVGASLSTEASASHESLLVFSDVHLGSDLNDSGPSVPRSRAIDRDLAALLAHYRAHPPAGRWRLVLAGDFVDFVGMSIDQRAGDMLETEPTAAERSFGLGGAEDHVRLKLERTRARHPDVFAELIAFVADGHAVTFIQGNHDIEMHWEGVRRDFADLLLSSSDPDHRSAAASRIEFEPWFFHREGLVFIEHGHQYDPFCATPYVLAPLSPHDPKRVLQSLSDTLLRYIVRRTPGMKEYGHENRGLTSYVSWGLMLGARGSLKLFKHFVHAVVLLWETAKAYRSDLGAVVREEHERRLSARAAATGVSSERLRAALELQVVPIGRTTRGVLASVMLDRLAVFLAMLPLLIALLVARSAFGALAVPALVAVMALWVVIHVWLSRGRPNVDPAAVMSDRAGKLAALFPSSFVVMGHTHVPLAETIGDATYINLGSWAEEEPEPSDAAPYRAARTHLVIHAREDRHEAHLCEWRAADSESAEGPHTLKSLVRDPRRVLE